MFGVDIFCFRFEKCDQFIPSVFWKHEASVLRCGASKRGLIDEVPSSDVYSQLQKLGTQNPACKSTFIFNRKYLQK